MFRGPFNQKRLGLQLIHKRKRATSKSPTSETSFDNKPVNIQSPADKKDMWSFKLFEPTFNQS
jgi:hypothetical protein